MGYPTIAGTEELRRSLAHVAEKLADIERQVQAVRASLTSLLQSLGQAAPPVLPAPEPCPLEQWLQERGLVIKRRLPSATPDPVLDRLARFLGERFVHLEPFYDALKQQVAGHESISIVDLRHASPLQLSDVVQFGHQLYGCGVLSHFRYLRGQRRIVFVVQKDGPLVNFITGGWLERYVLRQAVVALERGLGERVWALNNIVIGLPDGAEAELDILVGSRQSVWWIECTTSQDFKDKFKHYRHLREDCLKLRGKRSLLVVTQKLTEKDVAMAAGSAGMTLVRVTDLGTHLLAGLKVTPEASDGSVATEIAKPDALEPSLPTPSAQPNLVVDGPDEDVFRYRSVLKEAGLRPVEEHLRFKIIRDLCRLASETDGDASMEVLTGRLKEWYEVTGEPISKRVISDVRNALRRAGMCERSAPGESGLAQWRLRKDLGYPEMESAVAQVYLWTLLKNPELQAYDPLKWYAVARVIYGDRVNRWEVHQRIATLITEMEQAGRVIRRRTPNGELLQTVGETFWSPEPSESISAAEAQPAQASALAGEGPASATVASPGETLSR